MTGELDLTTIILERTDTGDDGTFGHILVPSEGCPETGDSNTVNPHASNQVCYTAELPWRGNEPFKSCIPTGTYLLARDYSPRFARAYHVLDVSKRYAIIIHAGNFAGDTDLSKKTDVVGCIAPGLGLGVFDEQRVVTSSRVALAGLEDYLDSLGGYAWLRVTWAEGASPLPR